MIVLRSLGGSRPGIVEAALQPDAQEHLKATPRVVVRSKKKKQKRLAKKISKLYSDIPYQILQCVQFGLHESNRVVFRGLVGGHHTHRLIHTALNVVVPKTKREGMRHI